MYESNFSESNAVKLNNIINDGCGYCSCLQMDKDDVEKQDKLFTLAEEWLNSRGIQTRTDYNNVLPTYNLFLKIGEWLERRETEERDE